jgi:integrase
MDKQYMIGGNKTEAGKERVIPIHDKIKPLIEQNLDGKYITTSHTGGKLTYNTIAGHFRTIMNDLGMNHKIHDTRKTAVSIMHSSGIPMETVRVIVGHSGKGVTETVYLYKQPHELVEAINMVKIPY